MVGCLTLTLLVGCSAAEKPVEQVKQVKNTITAKLATEEKMVEIDGQTIYFKRLVMKTTFTYDSWLWRVIRWFSKDLLRFSKRSYNYFCRCFGIRALI